MNSIDLTQVKELRGASNIQQANALMKNGWRLIDTASGKDESGYPITTYSLGWMGDSEPPQDY